MQQTIQLFIVSANCRTHNGSRLNMKLWPAIVNALFGGFLISLSAIATESSLPANSIGTNVRTFAVKGVVEELKPDGRTVVIQHEAISNYMAAMTMPFKVRDQNELAGIRAGDEILFQLHVSDTESWIGLITKIGTIPLVKNRNPADSHLAQTGTAPGKNPLLDYKFTNELGQAVSLNSFHGQALAVTFFFTRCPLPEFCPRLSKNFQEASQKLAAMTNAPSNWHFLSISFDTEFDSPATLKAYGESYQYDPLHWSFLTGAPDKISELARSCGMTYQSDAGTINHNFRTLIVDATGHLQMVFPTSGDLSDAIVNEIIKAAATTNQSMAQN
jgi:protein SCO1